MLQISVNGKLYYESSEYTDTSGGLPGLRLEVPRYIVKGTLKWDESCAGASGATVEVYDSDIGADELMGTGTTSSDGSYSVTIPRTKVSLNQTLIHLFLRSTFWQLTFISIFDSQDGNSWDALGNNPDLFVKFTGPNGYAGETSVKENEDSVTLDYGITELPRGGQSAADVVAADIDGTKKDFISVTVSKAQANKGIN